MNLLSQTETLLTATPAHRTTSITSNLKETSAEILFQTFDIYFDDYGAWIRLHSSTDEFGENLESYLFLDHGTITNYIPRQPGTEGQGWSSGWNVRDAGEFELPIYPDSFIIDKFGNGIGYTDLGTKMILGREAHGLSYDDNETCTIWSWNRIPLYFYRPDKYGNGGTIMKITKLDTDIIIPPEIFAPPADAKSHVQSSSQKP